MSLSQLLCCAILVASRNSVGVQSPPPAPVTGGGPRVSPDGARILFTSNRTGRSQIYLMKHDGSGVTQLTRDTTVSAFSPMWSPDGLRFVFISAAKGVNRVMVMHANGTEGRSVSEAPGDQAPSWSPDGSKILYATGTFPNINIHTMNTDGTGKTNLSPNPGFDYDPAWSPDGRRIAFVGAERGRGPRIMVMDADGSGRRLVSATVSAQERPSWSSDGRYLAFQGALRDSAGAPYREAYIYVVDMTTGVERRLGTHETPTFDETPSWFPDGKRLAIQSKRGGAWNVYIIDLSGMVVQQITKTPQPPNGAGPKVSPDGRWVAFTAQRGGSDDIYVIGIDGSSERQLTRGPEREQVAHWTAGGRELLYSVPAQDSSTLFVVGLDGTAPRRIGTIPGRGPVLLADGSVLFSTGSWQSSQLAIGGLGGAAARPISSGSGSLFNAVVSPDGKLVAYTRMEADRSIGVWVMRLDGSHARPVTRFSDAQGRAQVPAWSPDGKRLAIQAGTADPADPAKRLAHIWIIELSSGVATRLGAHSEAYLDETPSWFPDGKRIAFQSDRTGRMEVWIMNADGSAPRQLTH